MNTIIFGGINSTKTKLKLQSCHSAYWCFVIWMLWQVSSQGAKTSLKTTLKLRKFARSNNLPRPSLPLTNKPGLNKIQAELCTLRPTKYCIMKPSRFQFENKFTFYPQTNKILIGRCGHAWIVYSTSQRFLWCIVSFIPEADNETRALLWLISKCLASASCTRLYLHKATSKNEPGFPLTHYQAYCCSSDWQCQLGKWKLNVKKLSGEREEGLLHNRNQQEVYTLLFHCWSTPKSKNMKFQSDLISSLLGTMMTFSKSHYRYISLQEKLCLTVTLDFKSSLKFLSLGHLRSNN